MLQFGVKKKVINRGISGINKWNKGLKMKEEYFCLEIDLFIKQQRNNYFFKKFL